jgi:tetraacyldisaccharide 4'-kinase
MKNITNWFNFLWYESMQKPWSLKVLAKLYGLGQKLDQYRQIRKQNNHSTLPVIVVGNLTVGGTGKTPLIISLHEKLVQHGYRVGIVTRGYKNKGLQYPYRVNKEDLAEKIGDEAALLAQKVNGTIVISPKRQQGIDLLASLKCCDIVLSDDGLQHYAMQRALEIVVIDGMRGFGNGELLPLGPLREPIKRLESVDFILVNGSPNPELQLQLQSFAKKTYYMQSVAQPIYTATTDIKLSQPIAAFAGIGNPTRFFETLKSQNISFTPYIFPDHYSYQAKDFDIPESCIIMTEKDAIKCHKFTQKPIFILPISMDVGIKFWQQLFNLPLFKQ